MLSLVRNQLGIEPVQALSEKRVEMLVDSSSCDQRQVICTTCSEGVVAISWETVPLTVIQQKRSEGRRHA
eukprot:2419843-Pleurochrysis_carterae.AAC.6